MIIDLFTVIAQVINFLVLVLLLKKFLFNKIISIMDERENQIKEQLANAEQQEKKAQDEVKKQQEIREKLELEWDHNLAEIKKDLQVKQTGMIQKARKEVDEAEKNWRDSLEKQRSSFLRELKHLSCEQVCEISKKVLKDLANERLERALIDSFLNQLESMQKDDKNRTKLSEQADGLEVWTAFQVDKDSKALLIEKINHIFNKKIKLIFKESDRLICGIELRSDGGKIAWSMESYLDSLESKLKKVFVDTNDEKDSRINNIEGVTKDIKTDQQDAAGA